MKFNNNLRYNEKLNLNRKGCQAVFKSITRAKRDTLPDGKSNNIDRVPPPAYYKPRYGVLDAEPQHTLLCFKNIDQDKQLRERQELPNPLCKNDMKVDQVCKKMIRVLKREHQTNE